MSDVLIKDMSLIKYVKDAKLVLFVWGEACNDKEVIKKFRDKKVDGIIYDRYDMSLVVRKPAFCICENKDADQLRGNREADQRLCFCYRDSTIPLLSKSEISRL